MARLDLNAKRAARSEAENRPHEVVLGFDASGAEQVFLFQPRLHLETTSLLLAGRGDEVLKLNLVNPDDWERLRKAVPDESDLLDILNELYAADVGESPASARSSKNGGQNSRPTSKGSTRSTSAKRAGDKTPSASDA